MLWLKCSRSCTSASPRCLRSAMLLLTPNDDCSGRTAPLTSKRFILYISTNIGTEYFKRGIYSPFFSSSKCSLFHKSNVFGPCIIHILYTGCAKIKRIIPAPEGLKSVTSMPFANSIYKLHVSLSCHRKFQDLEVNVAIVTNSGVRSVRGTDCWKLRSVALGLL